MGNNQCYQIKNCCDKKQENNQQLQISNIDHLNNTKEAEDKESFKSGKNLSFSSRKKKFLLKSEMNQDDENIEKSNNLNHKKEITKKSNVNQTKSTYELKLNNNNIPPFEINKDIDVKADINNKVFKKNVKTIFSELDSLSHDNTKDNISNYNNEYLNINETNSYKRDNKDGTEHKESCNPDLSYYYENQDLSKTVNPQIILKKDNLNYLKSKSGLNKSNNFPVMNRYLNTLFSKQKKLITKYYSGSSLSSLDVKAHAFRSMKCIPPSLFTPITKLSPYQNNQSHNINHHISKNSGERSYVTPKLMQTSINNEDNSNNMINNDDINNKSFLLNYSIHSSQASDLSEASLIITQQNNYLNNISNANNNSKLTYATINKNDNVVNSSKHISYKTTRNFKEVEKGIVVYNSTAVDKQALITIKEIIKDNFPIIQLSDEDLNFLLSNGVYIRMKRDTVLKNKAFFNQKFLVILEGELRLQLSADNMQYYKEGDLFGELGVNNKTHSFKLGLMGDCNNKNNNEKTSNSNNIEKNIDNKTVSNDVVDLYQYFIDNSKNGNFEDEEDNNDDNDESKEQNLNFPAYPYFKSEQENTFISVFCSKNINYMLNIQRELLSKKLDIINNTPLLKLLNDDIKKTFSKQLYFQTFPNNHVIVKVGDKNTKLYYILKGSLSWKKDYQNFIVFQKNEVVFQELLVDNSFSEANRFLITNEEVELAVIDLIEIESIFGESLRRNLILDIFINFVSGNALFQKLINKIIRLETKKESFNLRNYCMNMKSSNTNIIREYNVNDLMNTNTKSSNNISTNNSNNNSNSNNNIKISKKGNISPEKRRSSFSNSKFVNNYYSVKNNETEIESRNSAFLNNNKSNNNNSNDYNNHNMNNDVVIVENSPFNLKFQGSSKQSGIPEINIIKLNSQCCYQKNKDNQESKVLNRANTEKKNHVNIEISKEQILRISPLKKKLKYMDTSNNDILSDDFFNYRTNSTKINKIDFNTNNILKMTHSKSKKTTFSSLKQEKNESFDRKNSKNNNSNNNKVKFINADSSMNYTNIRNNTNDSCLINESNNNNINSHQFIKFSNSNTKEVTPDKTNDISNLNLDDRKKSTSKAYFNTSMNNVLINKNFSITTNNTNNTNTNNTNNTNTNNLVFNRISTLTKDEVIKEEEPVLESDMQLEEELMDDFILSIITKLFDLFELNLRTKLLNNKIINIRVANIDDSNINDDGVRNIKSSNTKNYNELVHRNSSITTGKFNHSTNRFQTKSTKTLINVNTNKLILDIDNSDYYSIVLNAKIINSEDNKIVTPEFGLHLSSNKLISLSKKQSNNRIVKSSRTNTNTINTNSSNVNNINQEVNVNANMNINTNKRCSQDAFTFNFNNNNNNTNTNTKNNKDTDMVKNINKDNFILNHNNLIPKDLIILQLQLSSILKNFDLKYSDIEELNNDIQSNQVIQENYNIALNHLPWLDCLDKKYLNKFKKSIQIKYYHHGEIIKPSRTNMQYLYVVLEGEVQSCKEREIISMKKKESMLSRFSKKKVEEINSNSNRNINNTTAIEEFRSNSVIGLLNALFDDEKQDINSIVKFLSNNLNIKEKTIEAVFRRYDNMNNKVKSKNMTSNFKQIENNNNLYSNIANNNVISNSVKEKHQHQSTQNMITKSSLFKSSNNALTNQNNQYNDNDNDNDNNDDNDIIEFQEKDKEIFEILLRQAYIPDNISLSVSCSKSTTEYTNRNSTSQYTDNTMINQVNNNNNKNNNYIINTDNEINNSILNLTKVLLIPIKSLYLSEQDLTMLFKKFIIENYFFVKVLKRPLKTNTRNNNNKAKTDKMKHLFLENIHDNNNNTNTIQQTESNYTDNIKLHKNINFSGIDTSQLYIICKLGQGGFGKAFLTKYYNKLYVMKVFFHSFLTKSKNNLIAFEEEMSNINQTYSPFSPKIKSYFFDQERVYFLMSFTSPVTLSQVIVKSIFKFSPLLCYLYLFNLLIAIDALHKKGILHRDIKPSNLVMNNEGFIELIDFGVSKKIKDFTSTITGTPYYMAPEVIQGQNYSYSCDVWSIAVIIYEMIYNTNPFKGDRDVNVMDIYKRIIQGDVGYDKGAWLDYYKSQNGKTKSEQSISYSKYSSPVDKRDKHKSLNNVFSYNSNSNNKISSLTNTEKLQRVVISCVKKMLNVDANKRLTIKAILNRDKKLEYEIKSLQNVFPSVIKESIKKEYYSFFNKYTHGKNRERDCLYIEDVNANQCFNSLFRGKLCVNEINNDFFDSDSKVGYAYWLENNFKNICS